MTIPLIEHHVQQPDGVEYYALGKSDRPDRWCFRLRTSHLCQVELDDQGHIQTLRWQLSETALPPALVASFNDPDSYPFTLLRVNAEPLLVESPSSLLAGRNGLAVKTQAAEVVWIPSAEIIGFVFRLTDVAGAEPGNVPGKVTAGETK